MAYYSHSITTNLLELNEFNVVQSKVMQICLEMLSKFSLRHKSPVTNLTLLPANIKVVKTATSTGYNNRMLLTLYSQYHHY